MNFINLGSSGALQFHQHRIVLESEANIILALVCVQTRFILCVKSLQAY
jgi:hypothetical protein